MLMVLLIWVAWVTKKENNKPDPDRYRDGAPTNEVDSSPVSIKGRDFHSNYSLTLKNEL
jgi:hypothetical protein